MDNLLLRRRALMSNLKQSSDGFESLYLTFEALESGNFTFTMDSGLSTTYVPYISYSIDNGKTWVTTNNVDNQVVTVTTPTINVGDKVLWKSDAIQFSSVSTGSANYVNFSSTGTFNVSGNIMSLIYGDNFSDKTELKELILSGAYNGSFVRLFMNASTLVSASNLILPATTLTAYCYYQMFCNCTALTSAPELPATTLKSSCYSNMFKGCTLLTTVSKLPATTLAQFCYGSMFLGCTSLITAPELPATTLDSSCYSQMFSGCTSLTIAPELPATTLTISCYSTMFNGCTSLTTVPSLPATTLVTSCYQNMFKGCKSLTTAPELPATTLEDLCYQSMFLNCTSLTIAPVLPAITLVQNCYTSMFYGCTLLNYIKAMFTTTPSISYTANWVKGVSSTGTFVKNSTAIWNVTGVNGIPSGWTVETADA